ncbi:MAG: hypothetical protein JWN62_545 [Acidimicrobiales bacterium]|nr:hypothetical protein [Acidimicrobiales bacterium]
MAKYDLLFEHLCHGSNDAISMSFDEIEGLVGPLPASATRQRAWWANEVGGTRHVQSNAWLNAGREVEAVDPDRRTVRFSAPRWRRGA